MQSTLTLAALLIAGMPLTASADEKSNVLFIAVDDLNDWVGCFGGNPQVRTPNLDRLAAEGQNYERALAGFPLCCPFRGSMLTGMPSRSKAASTEP